MARDDGGNAGTADIDGVPDDAPPWFAGLYADLGLKEITGKKHNPKVVAYFRDAGFAGIKDDETAWCAACVNAHLERAGYQGSKSLAARSFERWGKPLAKPRVGCIVPMWRGSKTGWQGHVGLYVGETKTHVLVLGGNQGDAVSIAKYPKSRVLGYRWPRTAIELKTSQAAAGSAVTGATSVGLDSAVQLVEASKPKPHLADSLSPEVMQPLQEGLAQLVPFFQTAGIIAGVISVALAVYVIYRRTQDHKERGL